MVKVVVVGLDCADPNLIKRWEEYLPNLAKIIEHGTFGVLESSMPPDTVPAWDCFSTGKNPGKIGVYNFVNLDINGNTKIVDSTTRDSPTIWRILSSFGKKVGVLNVPVTYPPEKVNGFIVSGVLTPFSRKDYTYPPELHEELDKVVDGYETDLVFTTPRDMPGGEKAWLNELQRQHQKKLKATRYLMKRYDWDFFIVVFNALDYIQHYFGHYIDATCNSKDNVIKEWYVKIDETIGEIMETIDNDTYLIVMSDHGCGHAKSSFLINEWLRKEGLLKVRVKGGSVISSSTICRLRSFLTRYLGPRLIRKILLIIPPFLEVKGTHRGLIKRGTDEFLSLVVWSHTKAFAVEGTMGRIYINVKGTRPKGIVEPEKEYEEIRNEIIKKLREIKYTETGEKVFSRIYKKEELYWGKHSHMAPDLVVEIFANKMPCHVAEKIGHGKLWERSPLSGMHLKDGVWFIIGPEVKRGKEIDAKIIDLAPTILYLLDVPLPRDMDGKVLLEAFSRTRDIKYQEMASVTFKTHEYSRDEEEKIKERLRALGYIS